MQDLVVVERASQALKLSKGFLYKLPKNTPGVYRFGKSVRFCIDELLTALRPLSDQKESSNDH